MAEQEKPAMPDVFPGCIDLAEPGLGGAVIHISDEFFAPAKRMLNPAEPEFWPDRFDDHGKWMDGWESRRRRDGGHDHCVIRICPGIVHGVDIDTRHFTGNFPPAASLSACCVEGDPGPDTPWHELFGQVSLTGDSHRILEVPDRREWTHLKLDIFPDGGIARLRVYGKPQGRINRHPDWIDLVSADHGGRALACNDMHFGHMDNLLKSTPSANMGDGWETRRRREPGNDWVVLELGRAGMIGRAEVDTAHFRGNYPARCSLRGRRFGTDEYSPDRSDAWPLILPPLALGPDQLQVFERQLLTHEPVSHVRLDIYPDGGVARLRLFGVPE